MTNKELKIWCVLFLGLFLWVLYNFELERAERQKAQNELKTLKAAQNETKDNKISPNK